MDDTRKYKKSGPSICPTCAHVRVCKFLPHPFSCVECKDYKKNETVHAHWIGETEMEGHMVGECSHCHKIRSLDNFCANCGAIMGEA